MQDRPTRFIAAHATGRNGDALVSRAVRLLVRRTQRRPLTWHSDGWRGYRTILIQAYRQPLRTGRRGRPRLVIPPTLRLTQTVKHRDRRGRLQSVEVVAALGTLAEVPGTVHIERVNGILRDRLAALTRKTHAFAKRDATWDALLALAIFDHNGLHAHSALRSPSVPARCSPAMALGLTDHLWSWSELLTTPL